MTNSTEVKYINKRVYTHNIDIMWYNQNFLIGYRYSVEIQLKCLEY